MIHTDKFFKIYKKQAIIIFSLMILLFRTLKGENMRIKLVFEGGESIIDLVDNIASRDFYSLLPLELTFSDYVGKEKVSNAIPKKLNTQGLNSYNPSIGDLFYFVPWGNIGIFYQKQPFHSGLVPLSKIDNKSLDTISNQKQDFILRFEKYIRKEQ